MARVLHWISCTSWELVRCSLNITVWGSCFSLGSRGTSASSASASSSSLTHSLTHALTHSLTHARTHARTHALTHSLTHSVRCSTQSFHGGAAVRVAAAGRGCFSWAGAVHRASWLPFAWEAQYTESPGRAAARVAAGGPRLLFAWQAQYIELPGSLTRGRCSTQSLLDELRRAWPPLGRGCLFVAGAVHRASWLPFAWQAQCTAPPGGAGRRRST